MSKVFYYIFKKFNIERHLDEKAFQENNYQKTMNDPLKLFKAKCFQGIGDFFDMMVQSL